MAILKSIGVLSVAKITAVFYGIVGLIMGIFAAAMVGPAAEVLGVPGFAATGGVLTIVGGLIGGLIAGFLVGAIVAIIYNVLATFLGGIRLDLS